MSVIFYVVVWILKLLGAVALTKNEKSVLLLRQFFGKKAGFSAMLSSFFFFFFSSYARSEQLLCVRLVFFRALLKEQDNVIFFLFMVGVFVWLFPCDVNSLLWLFGLLSCAAELGVCAGR